MRAIVVLLGLSLWLSGPAHALEPQPLNNLGAGINGVLNGLADPIMYVIIPSEEFEDMPNAAVTGRLLGVPCGIVIGAARILLGVSDLLVAPFYIFPTMSPAPRWETIEGVASLSPIHISRSR